MNPLYEKYLGRTLCSEEVFDANVLIAKTWAEIEGDVVECGVWRGGMIAAIAETMGANRRYHLCDSFQGLPLAEMVDGSAALAWQRSSADNCRAEISDAAKSMRMAGIENYNIVSGWFENTLSVAAIGPIALLRLDADWFNSTMTCMNNLFPKVIKGGVIIIDDYYVWDGCAKAIHKYLADNQRPERIRSMDRAEVAYVVKL
jgi:O-methyltransferase